MKIESLYFGDLRNVTGLARETISIKEGAKLLDLIDRLSETYGKEFLSRLNLGNNHIILINGQNHEVLGGKEAVLREGDRIVFLPISMGG